MTESTSEYKKRIEEIKQSIENEPYMAKMREDIAEGISKTGVRQATVEEQFQSVIDETTGKDVISAPEIILARNGEANLKARLDKEHQEVNAQLAQKPNYLDLAITDEFEYTGLLYPPSFPKEKVPFKLYRDLDGKIKHDFNFDSFEVDAGHIWMDAYLGNNANDGLTAVTPVQAFSIAMDKANALINPTVVIHFKNNFFEPSRFGAFDYTLQKNIVLKSESTRGKTVIANAQRPNQFVWTQDGSSYKTTLADAQRVYDTSITDIDDLPKLFTKVVSVAEVQAQEYTWYADGSNLWVHRKDNAIPTNDDIALYSASASNDFTFNLSGYKLITRNIQFLREINKNSFRVADTNGTLGGEYWAENCAYGLSTTANGFAAIGVGKSYLFNCLAFDTFLDGFNYHARSIDVNNVEFAFEYDCKAYNNGDMSVTNANATTAHDCYTTLRIGSIGYGSRGPICADTQGCFSVLYDCIMYNSRLSGASAFSFGAYQEKGKAYLVNCQGGGINTKSLNAGCPVYLRNFKGKDLYAGTEINIRPY